MSDYIDTRDGWREVQRAEWDKALAPTIVLHGQPTRYWVREEPVPALPTVPYTVIRVTAPSLSGGTRVMILQPSEGVNLWTDTDGRHWGMADITGFEVLAEPLQVKREEWIRTGRVAVQRACKETAKAVLDRAKEMGVKDSEIINYYLPREFGVES